MQDVGFLLTLIQLVLNLIMNLVLLVLNSGILWWLQIKAVKLFIIFFCKYTLKKYFVVTSEITTPNW